MGNISLLDHRKYAWDYFAVHANQRLTTFNFYLVLSGLLTTGIFTAFKRDFQDPMLGIVLTLMVSFLSFVFRNLDERNKALVRIGEQALKFLEKEIGPNGTNNEPHVLQLFSRETFQTNRLINENGFLFYRKHYSYSDCFGYVFRAFGWGVPIVVLIHVVIVIWHA